MRVAIDLNDYKTTFKDASRKKTVFIFVTDSLTSIAIIREAGK